MMPENDNIETTELNNQIAALKNQVFTLLVALIVVSGTLTVSLYRQVSLAGKDLAAGQQLTTVLNENEANVQTFITHLVAYGQKHPEFVPLLKKYGIAPVPGVPANTPVAPAK